MDNRHSAEVRPLDDAELEKLEKLHAKLEPWMLTVRYVATIRQLQAQLAEANARAENFEKAFGQAMAVVQRMLEPIEYTVSPNATPAQDGGSVTYELTIKELDNEQQGDA